jgi:hypothetical protein
MNAVSQNKLVALAGMTLLVLLAVFSPVAGFAKPAKILKPNVREFEVVGEVVDSWCCASKTTGPGRGPSHLKCAQTCILGGVTAGIIDDDGNLYVAAKTRAYSGANRMLYPFIAKKVWAKGWLSEAGGSKFFKVNEVKEWKPGMKANNAPAVVGLKYK